MIRQVAKVTHAERCEKCGRRFVKIDEHRTKCPSDVRTSVPFHDDRLTPQQNKAVELVVNGFTRAEVMDEMMIGERHLNRLLGGARRRGAVFPPWPRAEQNRTCVAIETLVHVRDHLRENGVKWGLYRRVAAQCGMTANAARVRIWKHEKGQAA